MTEGKDMDRGAKSLWTQIIVYFPEIVVVFCCAVLLLWDIRDKEGYHMDELLSFELANGEFNPWIVPTQPQGRLAKYVENEIRGDDLGDTWKNLADTAKDVLLNRGGSKLLSYRADVYEEPVWIDGETFRDYITVGEEDAFNYLSVYFNVKDDNHPPLHFMVLHTVSSLFRGRIAPLMGCGINLLCVLGIMILLMGLGRDIMTLSGHARYGRMAGIWAAGLYGLSAGASSTTLLIRMYAMLTFFCVALFRIHLCKWSGCGGRDEDFGSRNGLLIAVTVLGFWTQYFFLFYCLALAAVTAVLLWVQKRRKELWSYIRSMLTAAVIGVAVFPFAISDVFASGRGVEALENLSAGLAGYGRRVAAFGEILLQRMGIVALLVSAALLGAALSAIRKGRGGRDARQSRADVMSLLCIPAAAYFLLAARMSPYLVDRYMMPVFPFCALIGVIPVCGALGRWESKEGSDSRKARAVVVLLLSVTIYDQAFNHLRYQDSYLYQGYERQEKIARAYRDLPCICVYDGVSYYENLCEFARYESTLLVTAKELENRQDKESVAAKERVVILLKHGTDREAICEILESEYGMRCEKVLLENGEAFGDTVLLFAGTKSQR